MNFRYEHYFDANTYQSYLKSKYRNGSEQGQAASRPDTDIEAGTRQFFL